MLPEKREHPKEKTDLHKRNKHRERYNFKQLIASCPELNKFVNLNFYNDESIDFFNPEAVKILNKALLKHFYGINNWEIPKNYLCPPVPGRADYIHNIADLLANSNNGKILKGNIVKCLDIGIGANCIYPIIGNREYGWSFIGSEIDPVAIGSANKIIESNPSLKGNILIRPQKDTKNIFHGIIQKDELFDVSICNPPFHASAEEARTSSVRKINNLTGKNITSPRLNFGGQTTELWCEGGEESFINEMIIESKEYHASCFWFSTLVSKKDTLKSVYATLKKVNAAEVKTIQMDNGNKISRVVAWTFLSKQEQKQWALSRWNK
jgi:23S rRNA (adenine1618-N6)-methyltransferase